MNGLHDLIAKLQKIEEATPEAPAPAAVVPATAAPAPAAPETMDQAIDRREKAAAAKQILQTMIKKKGDLNMVNGYFIEAGTGALLFSHPTKLAQNPSGEVVTARDIGFGEGKTFADKLTGVGLKITPETVTNPGIFGWKWTESTKTVLKINLKDLETIAQGKPPTQAPAPSVVTTNAAPVAAPVAAPPAATTTTIPAANTETQKKIDRVKAILGLKNTSSGYTAKDQNNSSLAAPAAAPAGVPVASNLAESIRFKSRIGRLLAEEFGVLEADIGMPTNTPTPRAELDTLWTELTKLMDTPGALTPEQRKDIEGMTQLVNDFRKNNPTDPAKDPAKPSTTMAPEPNIQAIQNLYNSLGITDNAGNKLKPDGVWGWRTEEAKWNFKKKYPEGTPEAKKAQAFADKIAKEFQWRVIPDKNGQNQRIGATSTKDLTALAPGNSQKVAPAAPAPAAPAPEAPAASAPAKTTVVRPQPTLNGKPSTGPKGQEWLKQYGATHNPDGSPKVKPAPEAPAASAPAAPAASATAKPPVPPEGADIKEINKYLQTVMPTTYGGEMYWVNGKVYKANTTYYNNQRQTYWTPDSKTFAGTYVNKTRTEKKYTGPDAGRGTESVQESVGFTNDELNRIISLVHHR